MLKIDSFMQQLRGRFNETINLRVVHDGQVLYVDILESSRSFRMVATIGSWVPIRSTALGKAIVANSPESEPVTFLQQFPPSESRKLKKELETARQYGYALDHEENLRSG